MRLWIAIKMTLLLTLLTGIAYPLALTGLAALLFPKQAAGSLVERDGQVVGSRLLGQNFSAPRYFHGRPSAAGEHGYDAVNSGGSNLGPTNKILIDDARTRLKAVLEANPGVLTAQVPIDLITASGSGLDPEISPAAAQLQVARVARARGLTLPAVRALVRAHTRRRLVLGEPGVNVLMLNLALDRAGSAAAAVSFR